MSKEIPMRVCDLRTLMGVGETYMSGLLAACNLKRRRLVLKSVVLGFLKDNPGWTLPRKKKSEKKKTKGHDQRA